MSDSFEEENPVRENQFTLAHLLGLMVLTAVCLGLAKWSEGEAGPYIFCLAGPVGTLLSLGYRRGDRPSESLADGGIASGLIWAVTIAFNLGVPESFGSTGHVSWVSLILMCFGLGLAGGVVGVLFASPIVGVWLLCQWLGAQISRPTFRKDRQSIANSEAPAPSETTVEFVPCEEPAPSPDD